MIEEQPEKEVCEYCSAEIPQGAIFCPGCGKRPDDKNETVIPQAHQPLSTAKVNPIAECSYCGEAVIPNTQFCWRCGRPIGSATMLAKPAAEVQPVSKTPVSQPAPVRIAQTMDLPKVKSTWRYPFLKILQFLLRIGGGAVMGTGMGLTVITVFTGTVITAGLLDQYDLGTTGITAIGNILLFFVPLMVAFLLAAPLFAAAEFIQMLMDIETNQRSQLAMLQHGGLR